MDNGKELAMGEQLICPVCAGQDKIVKVSDILKKLTHNRTNETRDPEDEWSSKHYEDKAELAEFLAPPIKTGVSGSVWAIAIGVIICIGSSLFVFIVGTILRQVIPGPLSDFFNCLSLVFFAALPFLLASYMIRRRNQRKTQWEDAKIKWDRLYYCYRDDRVFDPATGGSFLPQEITNNL